MYELKVRSHFDAAHYLRDYPGNCSRMHGHRWHVEVAIGVAGLGPMNMVLDFAKVKEWLKSSLAELDHDVVNEVLHVANATAEYIAQWLHARLEPVVGAYAGNSIYLLHVTVWESPDCCVKYDGN